MNRPLGRVRTHGVRPGLIERQASAVGLRLLWVMYDWQGSSKAYEREIGLAFSDLRAGGAEAIAFSDLYAERHGERLSALAVAAGLEPVFPLWGLDPRDHASTMLTAGVSARVCSVATEALPAKFAGRRFDADFLADLPAHVDPCGEADEFHTFVEWAPGWKKRIEVDWVRTIDRFGSAVADLAAKDDATEPPPFVVGGNLDWSDAGGFANGADYCPFRSIERLRRVERYVAERLAEEFQIDDVAAVAAMTANGFGRFFRRHVGVTFGSWLACRRVEKACELLRGPDLPVDFIARAVGLGTDRNLRRVFQKVLRCSPSEYRKRHLPKLGAGRRARRKPA